MFYLTACLCISLTVGTSGSGLLEADWMAVLLTLATLGLATELLGQIAAVRNRPSYATARLVRYVWVVSMAAVLFINVSVDGDWLVRPSRDQTSLFALSGAEPFPDAIWYALLVVGASALCGGAHRLAATRGGGSIVKRSALGVFLLIYLTVMVQELAFIPFFVHIATAGMEAAEPPAWQRQGTFPAHIREGFFTYRLVSAALGALAVTTVLLVLTIRAKQASRRRLGYSLFGCLWAGFVALCWWFHSSELPRVSPDMATAGSIASAWDLCGGVGALGLLSAWLACELTRQDDGAPYPTSLRSLGALPRWLAAIGLTIGGGVPAVQNVAEMLIDPVTFNATSMVGAYLDSIHYLLIDPWFILTVALALAGVRLMPAAWSGHQTRIHQVPAGRAATAFAMLFLLGVVAMPMLAAYGFGYWLGPWWR